MLNPSIEPSLLPRTLSRASQGWGQAQGQGWGQGQGWLYGGCCRGLSFPNPLPPSPSPDGPLLLRRWWHWVCLARRERTEAGSPLVTLGWELGLNRIRVRFRLAKVAQKPSNLIFHEAPARHGRQGLHRVPVGDGSMAHRPGSGSGLDLHCCVAGLGCGAGPAPGLGSGALGHVITHVISPRPRFWSPGGAALPRNFSTCVAQSARLRFRVRVRPAWLGQADSRGTCRSEGGG